MSKPSMTSPTAKPSEPAAEADAAALREAAERCVQLDTERAAWQRWTEAAERRAGRLEAALRDIEMETRPGGQWTLVEVNEVACAALAREAKHE